MYRIKTFLFSALFIATMALLPNLGATSSDSTLIADHGGRGSGWGGKGGGGAGFSGRKAGVDRSNFDRGRDFNRSDFGGYNRGRDFNRNFDRNFDRDFYRGNFYRGGVYYNVTPDVQYYNTYPNYQSDPYYQYYYYDGGY